MGSKSAYLEQQLLNHVLRNTAYTSPTTVYVGLFTTNPDEDASGTEVSGGSYARESAAFDAPVSESPGYSCVNSALLTFTTPTGSWGTISHWGLFDAVSGGNLLYYGAFDESRPVTTGDDVEIPAGTLKVRED